MARLRLTEITSHDYITIGAVSDLWSLKRSLSIVFRTEMKRKLERSSSTQGKKAKLQRTQLWS